MDREAWHAAVCWVTKSQTGLSECVPFSSCPQSLPASGFFPMSPRVFADDARGLQCPFVLCLHPQGCLRPKGGGQEELPHVRGQGQWPRVPDCDGAGTAERSYPASKVGGGGRARNPSLLSGVLGTGLPGLGTEHLPCCSLALSAAAPDLGRGVTPLGRCPSGMGSSWLLPLTLEWLSLELGLLLSAATPTSGGGSSSQRPPLTLDVSS